MKLDYSKPTNIKKIKREENKGEESSEEEDQELKKIKDTFNQDELFPKDLFTKTLIQRRQ